MIKKLRSHNLNDSQDLAEDSWSERLLRRIEQTGLTRREIALRAGIKYDALIKYVSGSVRNPRGDTLEKLGAALGVTERWLRYGGDDVAVCGNLAGTVLRMVGPVAPGVWMTDAAREAHLRSGTWCPILDRRFPVQHQFAGHILSGYTSLGLQGGGFVICLVQEKDPIDAGAGLVLAQQFDEELAVSEISLRRVQSAGGSVTFVDVSDNGMSSPLRPGFKLLGRVIGIHQDLA